MCLFFNIFCLLNFRFFDLVIVDEQNHYMRVSIEMINCSLQSIGPHDPLIIPKLSLKFTSIAPDTIQLSFEPRSSNFIPEQRDNLVRCTRDNNDDEKIDSSDQNSSDSGSNSDSGSGSDSSVDRSDSSDVDLSDTSSSDDDCTDVAADRGELLNYDSIDERVSVSSEIHGGASTSKRGNDGSSVDAKRRKVGISSVKDTPKKILFPNNKRIMCKAAILPSVFGKEADKFFFLSKEIRNLKVSSMNHAIRFWLAVKFCRLNSLDFEPGSIFPLNYTQRAICKIFDVGYASIRKFLSKLKEDDTIASLMKRANYMSPVENKPKRHKSYCHILKLFASNYDELEKAGRFK